MKANGFLRIIVILLLLSITIGFDQISKSIVRHNLEYYDQVKLLNNHFTLMKVENTGAFLSVGNSLTGPVRLISRTTLISVILIVGGGFGNIYDRMRYGSVTDFMHIKFGSLQTGIFNVADVSIMVGMIVLLLHAFFKKPDVAEEQPEQIN